MTSPPDVPLKAPHWAGALDRIRRGLLGAYDEVYESTLNRQERAVITRLLEPNFHVQRTRSELELPNARFGKTRVGRQPIPLQLIRISPAAAPTPDAEASAVEAVYQQIPNEAWRHTMAAPLAART